MMNSPKAELFIHDGLTPDVIRTQLNRILSSSSFLESPSASRLLIYLVNAVLSGQAHSIKQYTIAVEAFGYPEDFDPNTSNAVRVLAARLRGILERYYQRDGMHDNVRIEIPKRTYVPIFRKNLVLPEVTQNGGDIERDTVLFDYGPSIAVVPFSNRDTDENHISLADDITESIVSGLTQFRELSVIGPLMQYKGAHVEPKKIGEQYRVRFLLQGHVQSDIETIRVRAGLTDTCTGFKIWSQTSEYAKTAMSSLQLEDVIAGRIVAVLADHAGVIPSVINRESRDKSRDNLEIHEAIYRHEHFLRVLTEDAYLSAVDALELSIKANPHNAIALAMLSHAYATNYLLDMGLTTASIEDVDRLAGQAVALDPECQMAHFAEASVRFFQRQDTRCIAKLRLAVSLNPFNAYAVFASGFLICMLGHWKEGMHLWEKAAQLNARHPTTYFLIPFMYHYFHGHYPEAWDYAGRISIPSFWDPLSRAATAGQRGLHDQARTALQELLQMRPDFVSRARNLMQRFVYLDEHVEMLLDGLLKAGLNINHEGSKR